MLRLLSVLLLSAPAAMAADRPNIVVIMADDLGYGGVSCYGATAIATPHIDALATSGLRFTDGYCSASTCTPTRYSLLTGEYAFRRENTGIAPPSGPAIIPAGTTTVASLLQDAGYRTAVIGKWHLGLGDPGPDWNGELSPGPLDVGFDECLLLPTTNDRVPQVYLRNRRIENLDPGDPLWVGKTKPSPDHPTGKTHRDTLKMDWTHGHNDTIHNGISRIGFYTGGQAARFRDEDLADRWVSESVAFIERQAASGQPFFLLFASHDIHVPRFPHERFQQQSALGLRGDSILQLDWCVGELTAALDRLQLRDNTLVVFCSDNGPVMDDGYADGALQQLGNHDANGPYRGGKYSVYEGGCRTPFITNWPGTIAPGESDELVCTLDLAASLATIGGTAAGVQECIDSFDVSEALLGRGQSTRRSLILQGNRPKDTMSYRNGRWKLHLHYKEKARNVTIAQPLETTPEPRWALYDLSTDPEERTNLAKDNLTLLNYLMADVQEIQTNFRQPDGSPTWSQSVRGLVPPRMAAQKAEFNNRTPPKE